MLTTIVSFTRQQVRNYYGSEIAKALPVTETLEGHWDAGSITKRVSEIASELDIPAIERETVCYGYSWRFFVTAHDGTRVVICEAWHQGAVRTNASL